MVSSLEMRAAKIVSLLKMESLLKIVSLFEMESSLKMESLLKLIWMYLNSRRL